jgi:hypothetical protein
MATANHYLLDAVAVVVPILLGIAYAGWRHDRPPGQVVPSCDAFFLHVETTGAAQHVGGLVVLPNLPGRDQPTLDDVRRLARERLLPLPRFSERLLVSSRWRRPRWVETTVDVSRHVTERTCLEGLGAAVARLAEEPLPRDRPLWRLVLVRGPFHGRPASAVVVIVHHAMADGVGTILSALRLFDPEVEVPLPGRSGPGRWRRAAAVGVGLAQLAADGRARPLGPGSLERGFGIGSVPFEDVRRAARDRGVRVTDLVVAATAEAVRETAPDLVSRAGGELKVSVPLLVRAPRVVPDGNATAAVILTVPVRGGFEEILAEVVRAGRRLRRPTRAIASRFVMSTGLRALPEPCAAWFARTVYGARFLHLVVSNLPGPADELTMFGLCPAAVVPILPLAPGTPVALGAMSWSGRLEIGLAADPAMLGAQVAVDAIRARLDEVVTSTGARSGQGSAQSSGAPAQG